MHSSHSAVLLLTIMLALLVAGLPYSWILARKGRRTFAWIIFFASTLPIGSVFILVCGNLYWDYVF